jgi:phage tail-like protein
MTQTSELLPLRVQLVPMKLPEAPLQPVGKAAEYTPIADVANTLSVVVGSHVVIHPGEPSEILVKLENLESHSLHLEMSVEGNFPSHWCRIGTEGFQLPPKGEMEAVLYFQIPTNFFETSEILAAGQSLVLDYQGRLFVQATVVETGRQYCETITFNLYIRPRSLYLDFLPDLYREVDFIGRMLKIFEQTFEPAVHTLDTMWAHLNPLTAPESLLPFLAYWVGWRLHPGLSIARQRYLISRAMQLYRWRGTRRGLRFYLYLYTNLPLDEHLPEAEKHISIQEIFGNSFILGESRLGQNSIIGGGQPYHFIVQLKPSPSHELDEPLIHQIIQQEKPAFCTYELSILPNTS